MNGHQCRDGKPIHTIIYALTGKGKNLATFKGVAKIEQNIEAEETSQQCRILQMFKKKEVPVHYPKENVSTVRLFMQIFKS